ncbi:MAG: tetratricopeptide repeat protein [Bacteroidota bacterium]
MLKFYLTIIAAVIIGINYSNGQNAINISAKQYFDAKHYGKALKKYLEEYETKKDDLEINYNIGFCYLHINDDRSKAIPYLEYVYNKGDYKDDLLLNLGLAYMYAYKFEEALAYFDSYQKLISSKKAELVENYYEDLQSGKIDYQKKITTGNFSLIEHYIENCESAKELIKIPVNVTFENLGKEVNSKYADFYPFITQSQGTLYFSSRREENPLKSINSQGYFTSDIYLSPAKDGRWTKPKNMGPVVNSEANEQCVYVMPNGKKMIIFQDNENVTGDIYTVPIPKLLQMPPVVLEQPVNTEFREFEGSMTEDENTLIISSDRSGGFGETDLYIFHKLPNGEWGLPVNLGRQINTKYKEAFPMYDEKNQTLYFASEGHTNMGGFDIFKSQFDTASQKFEPPENIGYPINTPNDDMVFSPAENNRDGYISAVMNGGFGDLDLYKVVFNDIESRPTILKGIVSSSDGANKELSATISIKNVQTDKLVDSKKVNPQSGRYIFVVDPGKYVLKISSPDHADFEEEINVYDKSDYVFEIEKNILLQKTGNTSSSIKDVSKTDSEKSFKTMVRGVVITTDTLQNQVDAVVSVLDAKTRNKLEGKSANTQSGKYFFDLYPGIYILAASSAGYADFEQEIIIGKTDQISEIEKNILLQTNEEMALSKEKLKKTPVKPKAAPVKTATKPVKKPAKTKKKAPTPVKKKTKSTTKKK